jgi:hypothetical protein
MTTSTESMQGMPVPSGFPTAATQLTPPPKLRRRPSLIVASVLLVVIGALASAWAYTSLGTAQEVVAVRVDIARGQVIVLDQEWQRERDDTEAKQDD